MNGRISCRSIAVLFALTCLAGLLTQTSAFAQPGSTPYQLLWSEDFDSPTLDSRWNWVRENPTYWSLTARPGYMRITAQNGGLFGPGGTQENLLLTQGYSGDFLVTTKVDFAPTQNFEIAGLLIFQDEDNYLYLGRSYANGNTVRFRNEIGGSTQTIEINETATSVYLRIRRESNVYFAHYSVDGVNWVFVGNHNNNLMNPQLGIGATPGLSAVQIPADFNEFRIDIRPFNSSWSDGFSSPTLSSPWYWVREKPAKWSLTAKPGYLRLISEGGIYQNVNDGRNLLMMDPPDENFRITTKLSASPVENFQNCSIIVYQDDDNYLKLNRAYENGNKVRFQTEAGGVASSISTLDVADTTLYLRIVKRGDNYNGYYSVDGQYWVFVGYHNTSLSSPKVGVFTEGGGASVDLIADFDSFQIDYYRYMLFMPEVFG